MNGSAASCQDRLSRLSPPQQVMVFVAFARELAQAARTDFSDGLLGFEAARARNEAVEKVLAWALRLQAGFEGIYLSEAACEMAAREGWLPLLSRAIALGEGGRRPSRPSAPGASWQAPRASS